MKIPQQWKQLWVLKPSWSICSTFLRAERKFVHTSDWTTSCSSSLVKKPLQCSKALRSWLSHSVNCDWPSMPAYFSFASRKFFGQQVTLPQYSTKEPRMPQPACPRWQIFVNFAFILYKEIKKPPMRNTRLSGSLPNSGAWPGSWSSIELRLLLGRSFQEGKEERRILLFKEKKEAGQHGFWLSGNELIKEVACDAAGFN